MIKNEAPSICPICKSRMQIEVVSCENCKTKLTNRFEFSVFDRLSEQQKDFVIKFIGCDGIIKDMEKKLGISYPTVKQRLGEIKRILSGGSGNEDLMQTLEKLQNAEITVDDAAKIIKGGKLDG